MLLPKKINKSWLVEDPNSIKTGNYIVIVDKVEK